MTATDQEIEDRRLRATHPHAYERCERESAALAAMDTPKGGGDE